MWTARSRDVLSTAWMRQGSVVKTRHERSMWKNPILPARTTTLRPFKPDVRQKLSAHRVMKRLRKPFSFLDLVLEGPYLQLYDRSFGRGQSRAR